MKFTLRDVFWLFLVVALVLGWWIDHRNEHRNKVHWRSVANSLQTYLFVCRGTGASWDDKVLTVHPGHHGPEIDFDLHKYADLSED
jgi:hypothetical protein